MKVIFYNLLARLLPTKTVDSAVAGLTKFIAALEAAEHAQAKIATSAREQAAKLEERASAATAEATRAARIRGNVKSILA